MREEMMEKVGIPVVFKKQKWLITNRMRKGCIRTGLIQNILSNMEK